MEPDAKLLKLLIDTFTLELEEQTQIMTDAILALEKMAPADPLFMKKIDTIFRAAHNIKGASRGIGITDVGSIAHQLETLFSSIQKKLFSLTILHIDLALEATDKMRLAMQAYIQKAPLSFNIDDILSRLENGIAYVPPIEPIPTSDGAHAPTSPAIAPVATATVIPKETTSVESIRVAIASIDRVSALMEEIQVAKIALDEHDSNLFTMADKSRKLKELWERSDRNTTQMTDQILELDNIAHHLQKAFRHHINDLFSLTNLLQDEVSRLRLVPAAILLRTLPRTVRDLAQSLHKSVELHIIGDDVKMDKLILEGLQDPFMHLIRNALDHGIKSEAERIAKHKHPQGNISLEIVDEGDQILIIFKDDGAGLDLKKIADVALKKNLITATELAMMSDQDTARLIFRPGFSTSDIITNVSGRGIGLDVVKSNLAELKGSVTVASTAGVGTTFYLRVPLTLASERGLIVNCSHQQFVLPTHSILRVCTLTPIDITSVEGQDVLLIDKQPVLLRSLAELLAISPSDRSAQHELFAVIVKKDWQTLALVVDEIVGEREIVVKPLQAPLSHSPFVAGATLSSRGDVVLVLNAGDLIQASMRSQASTSLLTSESAAKIEEKIHILVVDDSITTRTLEQNVLENKGYKVTTAVNGKDAWELLQKQKFNLLITDVNMPIMDGFELTERVKNSEKLRAMPVIIVTSLNSVSEKKHGIEVGANAYIVKSEFESHILLQTVSQLV